MADNFFARSISLTLALTLAFGPTQLFAQDDDDTMDFGADDIDEDFEYEEDEGAMTFGPDDEMDTYEAEDEGTYSVGVVAIPSDDLTGEERRALQQKMQDALSMAPEYEGRSGDAVLQALDDSGLESCVVEPLCLAEAGEEGGVDRILMGRVRSTPSGLAFTIDLFDVRNKLFVQYTSANQLSDFDAVLEAVEPGMKDIFNIRVARKGPNYGDEPSSGVVQQVIAYTAAGLAVVALAGGIYFGLDASSLEDELDSTSNDSGGYDITQVQADRKLRDAQSSALTANILYGAAAGLAIISGILFYVESGSDVAEPDDRRRRAGLLDTLEVNPEVGLGHVGLGAGFSF